MTHTPAFVTGFDPDGVTPTEGHVDDPALVDAPYRFRSWRYFSGEAGAMAGIWEAGPHLERCACNFDEMCHILQGQVRLTDEQGIARIFGPGESFVIGAGFRGTWENVTLVRKVYFITPPRTARPLGPA